MSVFLALPLLAATGLYNPQVMHHGHCIAAPGSVDVTRFTIRHPHPRHLLIAIGTLTSRSGSQPSSLAGTAATFAGVGVAGGCLVGA